jgi:hypothetical protein
MGHYIPVARDKATTDARRTGTKGPFTKFWNCDNNGFGIPGVNTIDGEKIPL